MRNKLKAENAIPRISKININMVITPMPIKHERPIISSKDSFEANRFIIE